MRSSCCTGDDDDDDDDDSCIDDGSLNVLVYVLSCCSDAHVGHPAGDAYRSSKDDTEQPPGSHQLACIIRETGVGHW